MCLYPHKMINKKYTATEKNGGCVPLMKDERIKYVEIPCGNCIECRKQKAREWQVRLNEEIQDWKYKYLITFTFSPEELRKLLKNIKQKTECNAVCGYAIRHALEYWRKDNKKSLRHWCVVELGHENSERIHMHGLIFSNNPIQFEIIERNGQGYLAKWKYWKYGYIHVGDYVSERTVNYIVKYITKIDNDHKQFRGQIFASPGIGRRWVEENQRNTIYKYRPRDTKDYYRLNNGSKVKLPTYYRNKLYNEDERELMWRETLDKEEQYIMGIKLDNRTPNSTIERVENVAKRHNLELEYGDDSKEWRKKPHNITRLMLEHNEQWKREKNRKKRISIMQELGIGCPEAY